MRKRSLLLDIFTQGRIGPIMVDMTARQVATVLGPPRARIRVIGMIWHYGDRVGDLEVMFDGPRVCMVMITFWKRPRPVLPRSMLREYRNLPKLRRRRPFLRYLRRHGVSYTPVNDLTDDQQIVFDAPTLDGKYSVQLIFDREEDERLAKLIVERNRPIRT